MLISMAIVLILWYVTWVYPPRTVIWKHVCNCGGGLWCIVQLVHSQNDSVSPYLPGSTGFYPQKGFLCRPLRAVTYARLVCLSVCTSRVSPCARFCLTCHRAFRQQQFTVYRTDSILWSDIHNTGWARNMEPLWDENLKNGQDVMWVISRSA